HLSFVHSFAQSQARPSFPTRRSSDLMTLSDTAYQLMRNTAIMMMRDLGNFAGGCNVQFALNPDTEEIIAIEINPRVSRSSALASDRKSTRLNSSHVKISYAVFCLKKK